MLSDRHQGRSFPRSAKYHRPPYAGYWSTLAANHPSTSEKTEKNENDRCFVLGAEARRLMLPGPEAAAAHWKIHQKLEIFGNFVASRSAGPFVGRHFLLERHFAGEMISVGKARRCPFNSVSPHVIVQFTNEAVKCGLGGMSIATVFSQLITSPRSSNASFSLVSVSETTLQAALKLAEIFALFLSRTLKLAKSFALFLAKNLHLSFCPLKWRSVHTFRCPWFWSTKMPDWDIDWLINIFIGNPTG